MSEDVRLIKKYPNRRLYDTATSAYITLADVKKLVLEKVAFKVVDAKTNEDLTRSILLQIILYEEAAGAPIFSSDFLAQIIRFYGNAMQGMMGSFLEKNIHTFLDVQTKLREQSAGKLGESLNAEAWGQFLQMQGPAIQGLMSNYLERSAQTFVDMQQQWQRQTQNLFSTFPFPGFPSPPGSDGSKPDGGKT
ncbi:MAG: polyhydroxyalkanoate synthesis repressor PhaR [Betaproteobacteria bacterium]|nr:polyhydroxyalkanoate synthesis repressor PhaR [Betaproteobacteria bacterium]